MSSVSLKLKLQVEIRNWNSIWIWLEVPDRRLEKNIVNFKLNFESKIQICISCVNSTWNIKSKFRAEIGRSYMTISFVIYFLFIFYLSLCTRFSAVRANEFRSHARHRAHSWRISSAHSFTCERNWHPRWTASRALRELPWRTSHGGIRLLQKKGAHDRIRMNK